ncbi:MAG: metal-dependent hydrolase [Gemmatimonadota bacterium]|nr:metal-dependent hydrolase [Gemmatimonadota bacterium]
MIAGHVGLALGAKRIRPRAPLAALVGASLAPDVLEGVLRLGGASYAAATMGSHSIPAAAIVALVLAAFARAAFRDLRTAILVAALVGSHLLADYLTGLKPAWPGGPLLGWRLYLHPLVDFAVEGGTVVTGWALYRETLPERARKSVLLGGMLLLLLGEQAAFDSLDRFKPALHRLVDPYWP